MRKQPIIFVLAAVIIVALGVITYGIYKSSQQSDTDTNQQNNAAQQEAIDEARAFQPPEGVMCTQVMTPAVHRETGATHTFNSGCLPDGWERDDSASNLSPRTEDSDDPKAPDDSSRSSGSDRPASDSSTPQSTDASDRSSTGTSPSAARDQLSAEDQALREARSYRPGPDVMCTQVLTPAIHKATGARYTFPTGCLPDGWVRDRSDTTPRFSQ